MKKWLLSLCIGIGAGGLALLLHFAGAFDTWENSTWNHRARLLQEASPNADRIKLILLDQASLDWAQQESGFGWPWPRQAYVPLIQFCQRGGAQAVVFDVLFTEPSNFSVEDDEALATAMGDQGQVSLAMFLSGSGPSGALTHWPEQLAAPPWILRKTDMLQNTAGVQRDAAAFPILRIARRVAALGNAAEEPDADGIFRRLHFFRRFDEGWVPSLGLAPFLLAEQGGGEMEWSSDRIQIAGTSYPVDSDLRGIIRYHDPSSYSTYRASSVIQSELRMQGGKKPVIDPAVFRDAVVFFGFSAPGLKDLRPTPLSPAAPGVIIHANFFDNLLAHQLVKPMGWALLFVWIMIWSIVSSRLLLAVNGAVWMLLLIPVLLAGPYAASLIAYRSNVWMPLVCVEWGAGLAMLGTVLLRFATEGRQKLFIKRAFRHYLSPAVIEEILKNPEGLKLGGERKTLTIFFSDIAGFSGFSERMDPEDLTALLNDYLSEMTEFIQGCGGTVDKYIGDAIVAFWNAPINQPDHPVQAVTAAIACQNRLHALRPAYQKQYDVDLRVRIGIHTGEVTVGNMGSRDRFDYSILGDAANLASRLEGVNKVFGSDILISEETWDRLGGEIDGREVGRVRVVGREGPVTVYQVFSEETVCPMDTRTRFAEALSLIRAGRTQEAQDRLKDLDGDPVAERYRRVLRERGGAPWDGVWNLTEK